MPAVTRLCYTYLIGWSSANLWYYGRRTANNCHPSEFWVTYFTSSRYVSKTRKELGDPDIIQIRRTFESTEKCCDWEVRTLRRLKVLDNDKWLNKAVGALWKNNPCCGEFNGFYGKKHDSETLKRAVETRRNNGSGDYFQGKVNPLQSEEVLRINTERMIKNNPMKDPEIKKRASAKTRETQKSFKFWFEKYFKKNSNWIDILEFITSGDRTAYEVSKTFNLSIDGAKKMIKRIKEEYDGFLKGGTPCPL